MTNILVIVKGNDHAAMAEAARRGISLEVDAISANGMETYCYAPLTDKSRIVDWYSRANSPCVEGDCLWYSVRED